MLIKFKTKHPTLLTELLYLISTLSKIIVAFLMPSCCIMLSLTSSVDINSLLQRSERKMLQSQPGKIFQVKWCKLNVLWNILWAEMIKYLMAKILSKCHITLNYNWIYMSKNFNQIRRNGQIAPLIEVSDMLIWMICWS